MREGFLLLLFIISIGHVGAQGVSIMSYNCENAFDTIHDEGFLDEEYTPDGSRHWSRFRMFQKLKNIGKVIVAADTQRPVDIICLEEVENDSVLTLLCRNTALATLGYEYLMTHSADRRGIDVALLYSPFTFHPISHQSIRAKTSTSTRDVLHVCGTTGGSQLDTLDIYVVHLPSKLNGKASERNRQKVVDAITASTDSILKVRKDAKIIILGDFNEGPESSLLRQNFQGFTNLALRYQGKHSGSYKYQGEWETIDQILISNALTLPETKGLRYDDVKVLNLPFLLEKDEQYGGEKPKRTFVGYRYNGGFSDHLPVLLKLK